MFKGYLITSVLNDTFFFLFFFNKKSFRQSLMEPEFVLTDFAKMERPAQLHLGYVVSLLLIVAFFFLTFPYFVRCSTLHLLYPFHPNISMYILHTVLYIFPLVFTVRFCQTIKSFFD